MAIVAGVPYPEDRYYDIDNQIWYAPLDDGLVRAGYTPWAVAMMGEVVAFTPKRPSKTFTKGKSFAVIESGKWVGSARAAFAGIVMGHNEALLKKPSLLMRDALGEGWMLIVRPEEDNWRQGLTTGPDIGPAFEAWIRSEAYKDRAE